MGCLVCLNKSKTTSCYPCGPLFLIVKRGDLARRLQCALFALVAFVSLGSTFLHVNVLPKLVRGAFDLRFDSALVQPLDARNGASLSGSVSVEGARKSTASLLPQNPDIFNLSTVSGLCESHKELVRSAASSFDIPDQVLHKLSCDKLQRAIYDWYRPTKSSPFQLYRLTRVVEALEARRPVKIAVLGGSVSAGRSDYFQVGGKEGAWPMWLERMLHAVWKTVEVDNLSFGGASSKTHALRFDEYASRGYDIFLLELAVNDQTDWSAMRKRKRQVHNRSSVLFDLILPLPNRPAVACVELFRSSFRSLKDATRHCSGHVRELGSEVYFCDQWWYPQDWRKRSRISYEVPMVSYRDAVFPDLAHPPADLNETWSGKSHPGPLVHFWIAETVFFAFLTIKSHMSKHFQRKTDLDLCVERTTSLDALRGLSEFSPESRGCGWEFKEDVAEKPGWIIESSLTQSSCDIKEEASREISFRLKIGNTGLIVGTFLVSYGHGMGKAEVWLPLVPDSRLLLDSKISQHFSIPQDFRIRVPQELRNQELELKLRLVLDGPENRKFKLLTLSSC